MTKQKEPKPPKVNVRDVVDVLDVMSMTDQEIIRYLGRFRKCTYFVKQEIIAYVTAKRNDFLINCDKL